jgi:hypothetical protein
MTDDIKCPVCGSKTILRTAKKGPDAGKKFFVCVNYPKCKGKLEQDQEWEDDTREGPRSKPETPARPQQATPGQWQNDAGVHSEAASGQLAGSQRDSVPPCLPHSPDQSCWLRHSMSIKDKNRGDLPSNVDVFVLSSPESLYPNVVNQLHPWNGQVFFPTHEGDFVVKVANVDFGEVITQIRSGDYELTLAYHEYPTYPILFVTLRTGTRKQTGKPHCIECLADYQEANFQDFVLGIQNNKKINIHIFDQTGMLRATCPFQCKTQFCNDMLNDTKKADEYAKNIPSASRSFVEAAKRFFSEHPA